MKSKEHSIYTLIESNKHAVKNNQLNFTDDQIFQKGLDELIKTAAKDAISLKFYFGNCMKALKEARANQLGAASALIERAQKYAQLDKLDEKELKIYQLIRYPIEAYIAYKHNDYEKSFNYTMETILIDETFEKEFPVMFFHRIQQLHNLSRIFVRQSKYEEACEIVNLLLKCLVGNISTSYSKCSFDVIYCIPELKKLRKLMAYQVFYETVGLFNKLENTEKEEYLFNICFNGYENWKDPAETGITYWANAKDAYYKKNDENQFVTSVSAFLKNSNDYFSDEPLLNLTKYIIEFFHKKNTELSSKIEQLILEHA